LAPVALLPLSIAALYVAFAWFGLFRLIPFEAVKPVAVLFAIAFIWSLKGLSRLQWPHDAEASRRLEEKSGLAHRALAALEDQPATGGAFADALFREHKRRMALKIGPLATGMPSPGISNHDPYALRAIPILALFVAFGFSWSNHAGRLFDPFSLKPLAADVVAQRVDVWITPPVYTHKPPLFLTEAEQAGSTSPLMVPDGSMATVRLSGEKTDAQVTFTPAGTGKAVELVADKSDSETTDSKADDKGQTFRLPLKMAGTLNAGNRAWTFDIIKDTPPEIAFDGEPKRAISGALEIGFTAKDDYGLQSARADIEPADQDAGAVPLYPPPEFRLELPRRDALEAKGLTSRDLTEHPLSGKKVRITLVATDAAGNEGRSETKEIILPQRYFREPLAAAAAEERQVFSLDERKLDRAIELNDALFLRPEETIPNTTHFLLLQSAGDRMRLVRSEAALKDTADYLWQIALGIDGGDVANAERKVKDAQQALSDALNRNASDQEISKLMEDLRKAMNEFMQALAQQMQNNPNQNQLSAAEQKMIRQQDLQKMMDEIQKLAESGSRDEARNLLNQMQRMMNNMQTARPSQQNQRANDQMRQQMDKLGKLLQEQKKLMDETFSKQQALQDRLQRGDPNNGDQNEQLFEKPEDMPQEPTPGEAQNPNDSMTEEQLRQALKELGKRQQGLQSDLQSLQQGLQKLGIKPGEGFKSAGKEMKDATGALGEGQGDEALGAQGRAIQALRKGAQDMLQQMAQGGQGSSGGGQTLPGQPGNDPLGRPQAKSGPDFGENVKVPDEFDTERARQILETIRRKLGENASPELERQYLERLLDLR
jgi:uncharacterized protein (TIGR02302 family)